MKRSEALKEIEDVIIPCNSSYKKHRELAAERILKRLEELGMLAPTIKLDKLDGSDNGWENE